MATTEELLAAVTAAMAANLAAGGISSFRENEDSASFHSLSQYAALLRTLSNDEVAGTINNAAAGSTRPKVFTFQC